MCEKQAGAGRWSALGWSVVGIVEVCCRELLSVSKCLPWAAQVNHFTCCFFACSFKWNVSYCLRCAGPCHLWGFDFLFGVLPPTYLISFPPFAYGKRHLCLCIQEFLYFPSFWVCLIPEKYPMKAPCVRSHQKTESPFFPSSLPFASLLKWGSAVPFLNGECPFSMVRHRGVYRMTYHTFLSFKFSPFGKYLFKASVLHSLLKSSPWCRIPEFPKFLGRSTF